MTDLSTWTEDQLFSALAYTIDELVDEHPGLREKLPEVEGVVLTFLCQEAGRAGDEIAHLPRPDREVLQILLQELSERPEFQDTVQPWLEEATDDRTMGFDPLTGAIVASAIYFLLTTDFEYSREKSGKGSKKTKWSRSLKISRKKGVAPAFLKALIGWFSGGQV